MVDKRYIRLHGGRKEIKRPRRKIEEEIKTNPSEVKEAGEKVRAHVDAEEWNGENEPAQTHAKIDEHATGATKETKRIY